MAKRPVKAATKPAKVDALDFLDAQHPIYKANRKRWEQNEARYAGGDDVLDELMPFDWETDLTPTGHLAQRRAQAYYINFPEIFASAIAGHLLRFAPKPGSGLNFGTMGKVSQGKKLSTQADIVYQNPDGLGNTGSGWDLWWSDVTKLGAVTGHRWIYVESTDNEGSNQEDELNGLRPYLCEYSPLDVPNWKFNAEGKLLFAVIRFWEYNPTKVAQANIDPDSMSGYSYLLVTRADFIGFGGKYSKGGWWKFTPEKEEYDQGDFDDENDEIPLFIHYYDRSKGTRKRPALSRPGITELGQAAIASMNVASAANFNAVDSGQGLIFMLGVDDEGQDLVVGQIQRGDKVIGVPVNQDTDTTPTIATSGQQSVTSTVFDAREKAIWQAVIQLGISEAVSSTPSQGGGPGNSGSAQAARFGSGQAPRIVRVAANLEISQQTALYFLEKRFGATSPTSHVAWPRKFDLVELVERIKQFFEVQRLSGISSETLDSQAMLQIAEDKGLVQPQDKDTVLKEFKQSAKLKRDLAQNQVDAAKMAPPQSTSTRDKQKARMAGRKQDKRQGGKNLGLKAE